MNKINKDIGKIDMNDTIASTIPCRTMDSMCWFTAAENNYKTADFLLRNKIYCHAIFFMQQCTECLVKGILVENNIVSFHDLKSWSHKPELAIDMFFEQIQTRSTDNLVYIKDKLCSCKTTDERFQCALAIVNSCTDQASRKLNYFCLHQCVDLCLYTLAVLFSSSQQDTRYPDVKRSLPTQKYDDSTIVRKVTPELLKCIKYILREVVGYDML